MKRTHEQANSQSESEDDIDEHLYFTKDDVEKTGRKYVNMPKKGLYRMHAHINPFNPLTIAHPLNTTYVDWAEHYPHFYGFKDQQTIVVNTKKHPVKGDYKVKITAEGGRVP